MGEYMEGGKVEYNGFHPHNRNEDKKESMLTDQHHEQQNEIQVDYELEAKMVKEKGQLINEVEQSTVRINEIMNEVGVMIG